MQALSLLFLTLTGLGSNRLLQLLHLASGCFGWQPRIMAHSLQFACSSACGTENAWRLPSLAL